MITQGVSRIVEPLFKEKINIIGIVDATKMPSNLYDKKNVLKYFLKIIVKPFTPKLLSLYDMTIKRNIPFYSILPGKDNEFENWVKELSPDLIVVFSMSQLLKENIISIPDLGVINLHTSLLPKYRGPFPDFWMYFHKDLNPGVTVHYIDKGEDTGDIIYQESFNMPLGTKSPKMLDIAIGEIGSRLMIRAIRDIQNGNAPRKKQPKESTTIRARRIEKEEHNEIICWNEWDIERIWHLLRGTELWLNAVEQPEGIFKGQRWVILDYQKAEMSKFIPSRIYNSYSKKFIACKDGKIYIKIKFNLKIFILNLMR